MKKIGLLLMPLVLTFLLTACGFEGSDGDSIKFSDIFSGSDNSTSKFKEDTIVLEDGRTLLCIESKENKSLSCDWDNAKIVEEIEENTIPVEPQSSEQQSS